MIITTFRGDSVACITSIGIQQFLLQLLSACFLSPLIDDEGDKTRHIAHSCQEIPPLPNYLCASDVNKVVS